MILWRKGLNELAIKLVLRSRVALMRGICSMLVFIWPFKGIVFLVWET